jgi:hypothetical protein
MLDPRELSPNEQPKRFDLLGIKKKFSVGYVFVEGVKN